MLTIQLPTEYEMKLTQIAQTEQQSAAEIIRQALERYFAEYPRQASAYELGEDLFDQYGSGKGNLSVEYKRLIKKIFHEKHAY